MAVFGPPLTQASLNFNYYLLCRQFYKLSQDDDPLTQTGRHADFRDNPILDFVKSTNEHVQVCRNLSEMMTAKRVVD